MKSSEWTCRTGLCSSRQNAWGSSGSRSRAQAPVLVRRRRVGLLKPVEDMRQQVRRNTYARIAHRDPYAVADALQSNLDRSVLERERQGFVRRFEMTS
jgi:hypothetical protein